MEDTSEQGGPEALDAQLAALKSSSTNLRIEALRKLQHTFEGAGETTSHQNTSTFSLTPCETPPKRNYQFCYPPYLRRIHDIQIESLAEPCSHASEHVSRIPLRPI